MLALYLVKLLLAYSVVRFLAEPLIAPAHAARSHRWG